LLEQVTYLDTYRDPERLGKGKKSLLFSLVLRGRESTLTSAEADRVGDDVLDRCQKEHGAKLRA
jgi:phenylalanyl-tRNA synthetase beta chain